MFFFVALGGVSANASKGLSSGVAQNFAVLGQQLAAIVGNIVTLVAIAGEGDGFAAGLQIAQPYAGAEDIHLATGVIHIILTAHIVAGRFQHIGNAGAVGCAATVANVQRASRVGRDKLNLHRFIAAGMAAKLLTLSENIV